MSQYDDTAPLLEWLRQPRWMEGAKQKRLFEAANEIEHLRNQLVKARDLFEIIHKETRNPTSDGHAVIIAFACAGKGIVLTTTKGAET